MRYHWDRFAPHDPSKVMVINLPPAGEVLLLYAGVVGVVAPFCWWLFTL